MKLITLILDGQNRVHLAAVRAPDLLRREIAALSGGAELVYVAVPPPDIAAERIVARVAARCRAEAHAHAGPSPARTLVTDADPRAVRARLVAEQALVPAVAQAGRALRWPLRRLASLLRRLAQR